MLRVRPFSTIKSESALSQARSILHANPDLISDDVTFGDKYQNSLFDMHQRRNDLTCFPIAEFENSSRSCFHALA